MAAHRVLGEDDLTLPSSFRAGASSARSPAALPPGTTGSRVFFSAVIQDTSLCTSSDVTELQGYRVSLPGLVSAPRALLQDSHTAVTHSG